MNNDDTRQLIVNLEGASDSDQEELEALTLELRQRILELDVESVDFLDSGTAPSGSKSSSSLALGSLIITVGLPLALKVLDVVKTWVERRPVRTAKVSVGDASIELVAISGRDQQRLMEDFFRRSIVAADDPAANSANAELDAEDSRER